MKRRRHNLIGRACGVVAVVLVSVWIAGRWFVNVFAVSPGRTWIAWVQDGKLGYAHKPWGTFSASTERCELGCVALVVEDRMYWQLVSVSYPREGTVIAPTPPPPPPTVEVEWVSPSFPFLDRNGIVKGAVAVPLWWSAAPFAILATFTEIRHRRTRGRVGMCPSCGYNRAGLAQDAVCPECGKRA